MNAPVSAIGFQPQALCTYCVQVRVIHVQQGNVLAAFAQQPPEQAPHGARDQHGDLHREAPAAATPPTGAAMRWPGK
ncbi:hypothetical protein D3C87_2108350 [compost metagenome]